MSSRYYSCELQAKTVRKLMFVIVAQLQNMLNNTLNVDPVLVLASIGYHKIL